jgi:fermentation-respiration switch protein FrsA (DUF1100 family)
MKKTALLLFTTLICLSIYPQDISGKWTGILKVQGVQLRLVFNIFQTDDGYMSTMDSPDQAVNGIPVSTISYENQVLKLEVSNASIRYEGLLNNENIFVGNFKQGGLSIPLNLTKGNVEAKKILKPQEPTKPYPYYTEEVKFENTKDKLILAGTLNLPEKEGNFPAVILISGSGPQNRDEELMGHKPYLILSDYLTKNGIAVLRFDDRGTAESTGNFATATTLDFATDVEFALKYLQTRKEINKNKIGLIGHSEGAVIAPIVAAKFDDINFIVLLAGTGIRGDKLLLLQQELIGKASGVSDAILQNAKVINEGAFDIIIKSKNTDSLETKLIGYIKKALKDNPDSGKPAEMDEDEYVNLMLKQLTSPWMYFFIKYNPATVLKKVKCPVLAINGEKDLQVPATVNLDAIKIALEKGGNKNLTTKKIPNLNHLFQECETGSPFEYATIEQTFSPIALEEISDWILKQLK